MMNSRCPPNTAAQFYPSPGKPMRGWVEITDANADWVALANEANAIAADAARKTEQKR